MFDVVWANPDRELVGQRKARKEKEKEKKEAGSSGSRSIASAETELSVRSRKPQSFLESIRLRKKKARQDAPSLATTAASLANRDSLRAPPSMTSGPSSPSSPSSRGRAGSAQHSEASFHRDRDHDRDHDRNRDRDRYMDSGSSQNRSSQDVDSILSKWTIPNSLATMLSLEEDTALELRPSDGRPMAASTSHGSDIVQTVLNMPKPADELAATPMPPLTPMASPQKSLQSPLTPSSLASFRKKKKKKTASPQYPMPVPVISTKHTDAPSFTIPGTMRTPVTIVRSPSTSWHATAPWDNGSLPAPLVVGAKASTRSSSGAVSEETRASTATSQDDAFASLSTSLSKLQKQMFEMAGASHDTYLVRLTEEWGAWTDAALYKEMEMEKKRWLLSALYGINPAPKTEIVRLAGAERRILTFFDTQATTSYISATNAGVPVHHMGPIPLSSRLFPNVSPMQTNAASYRSLATTPPVFSDIYSLALPVLVPASDLPMVLHNMHRVLKPQGTLHLFLIDASPARSVTGPRLQAWLDEHLLLNLERLFRCTSPTRLFPNWLRDAHFQLTSHAKVVCRFEAAQSGEAQGENASQNCETRETETPVVPGTATFDHSTRETTTTPRPHDAERTEQTEQTEHTEQTERTKTTTDTDTDTTRRLQTVIGQKIWQEVWGPYVTADRWWWEDEACREECVRMGTEWEYHIVDAVKKERYVASQL